MRVQLLTSLLFLSLSSSAFAENKDDLQGFENRKKEILQRIDERQSFVQKEKECIGAAQNHDALKKCREINKEQIDHLREKRQEHRRQSLDDKIKKLQDQKAKLES